MHLPIMNYSIKYTILSTKLHLIAVVLSSSVSNRITHLQNSTQIDEIDNTKYMSCVFRNTHV